MSDTISRDTEWHNARDLTGNQVGAPVRQLSPPIPARDILWLDKASGLVTAYELYEQGRPAQRAVESRLSAAATAVSSAPSSAPTTRCSTVATSIDHLVWASAALQADSPSQKGRRSRSTAATSSPISGTIVSGRQQRSAAHSSA
jgi:hypothetical protein